MPKNNTTFFRLSCRSVRDVLVFHLLSCKKS